jgi:AcrR family transcriptional regulator
MSTGGGLREVSRRAVRSRIAEAAEALFIAKGFEETTVDEIAAEVGMSQRSFFRYFASKDDVILDNLSRFGAALAQAVGARPAEEPEWDSLHRAFDLVVEQFTDLEHDAVVRRIIEGSPRLLAAYLQRLDRVQQDLTEVLMKRATARPGPAPDRIVMRAMVGAAFACLHSATSHVAAGGDPERFERYLGRAMAALRPAAARTT